GAGHGPPWDTARTRRRNVAVPTDAFLQLCCRIETIPGRRRPTAVQRPAARRADLGRPRSGRSRPSGRLRRASEGAPSRVGLASNDLQVGLRRLVRVAAVLLPITRRSERDTKGLGKLDLRHVKRPANALRQRNAGNPSKTSLAVLDRPCG